MNTESDQKVTECTMKINALDGTITLSVEGEEDVTYRNFLLLLARMKVDNLLVVKIINA